MTNKNRKRPQNLADFDTTRPLWIIPDYSDFCCDEDMIDDTISEYINDCITINDVINDPSMTLKMITCYPLKFPAEKDVEEDIELLGIKDVLTLYEDLYAYGCDSLDFHQEKELINLQKSKDQAKYLVENYEVTRFYQIEDADYPLHKTINLYDWIQEHKAEHLKDALANERNQPDNDDLADEKRFQYYSNLMPNRET